MNDMRAVIIPKSDQLNADDLLAGPRTITITSVTIRPGTEQPVSIFYEGDNGKPYKCCKSMARVMVHCWGADANEYVGRSMTLYCDPMVKWGGMAVGGIRISHMTDIKGTKVMALTETKGRKQPFTVQPLVVDNLAGEAAEAAHNGVEAYKEFWGKLSKAQHRQLAAQHDSLKAAAALADDKAASDSAPTEKAETPAEPPPPDDDIFPGDRPSQAA